MTAGKGKKPDVESGLTDDEAALWDYVTLDVEPITAKRRIKPVEVEARAPARRTRDEPALPKPPSAMPRKRQAERPPPPVPVPKPPALQPVVIERRKARRIAKGGIEIEARLDLHGMRQDEAHVALRGFLKRSAADGRKMVLVITGKGGALSRSASDDLMPMQDRGVLRRNVPRWLAEPDLAGLVIGTAPAHVRHGGDGAMYVMLRRRGS